MTVPLQGEAPEVCLQIFLSGGPLIWGLSLPGVCSAVARGCSVFNEALGDNGQR